MNIQAALIESAISMLPKIDKIIKNSGKQERSQIVCMALRTMDKSFKPISEMNKKELNEFQDELLDRLPYHGYI